jgi:putative ABC transport system permease protein
MLTRRFLKSSLLQLAGRLRAFFWQGSFDSDFEEELESHLDMLVEDHRRRGLTLEQARRAARLELGGLAQLREAHREVRGFPLLAALLQDLRYALRTLSKTPRFTATALAVLALGMGANTAVFSVINAVLWKPIPYPDPDRIVVLMNTLPRGQRANASPAKFQHWRSQSDVLENVTALCPGVMNYTAAEIAEQVPSAQVSSDYFRCYGIRVIRGRTFTPVEDLPGGPHVVVIGDAFWQRQFARDPRIIGQTISLSGDPYEVIGISGENFESPEFGRAPDVYVPFQLDPNSIDQGHYFTVAARLKPGVTLAQAQARLQRSAGEYRTKFPGKLPLTAGFTVMPFREAIVGNVRFSLLMLACAVGFVLLIASANVANLLLVRATERRREIGIRIAIGAARARIVRQLLTESVLLSLAGGVLGLLLGFLGIRALLAVNTAGLPRVGLDGAAVSVDWRVLSFTLLVAVTAAFVFGFIPALHGSRTDVNGVLKDPAGRRATDFRQSKALSLLVIGEVSLAVILVVGSVLLIRTSIALRAVDPGFDARHVLTMRMSVSGPRLATSGDVEQMIHDGLDRIRALPGVLAASATCCVPLQGGYALPFQILGSTPAQGSITGSGGWATIFPGFFEVFRIPVKRGRTFTDRDDANSPAVMLINETMARRFWKDRDPLGESIAIAKGVRRDFDDEPVRQIVGIVGDVHDGGLNREPDPIMYVPQTQLADAISTLNTRLRPVVWVVRTEGEPHALAAAMQEQLRQSSGLPVSDIQSMDEVVSQSTSPLRFNMLLITVFGACAVLLAAIGIYGLMTYTVERRAREIGIRLALGADADQVKNAIVFQGMRLALAGVAIGLASAFGLTRFLASFLFGVQPRDPMAFLVVPVALTAIALFAVCLPANRASRIDPTEALRHE